MTVRLTLICHAATAVSRRGGFALADEPLDDGGARQAARLTLDGPLPDTIAIAPSEAARRTAALAGLSGSIAPALADADWGTWQGRSFESVHAAAPDALATWLDDPLGGAPGGESFEAVVARVRSWLDGCAAADGRVVAITHATTIRALLYAAICVPGAAALRIDLPPLARVDLSHHRGWRLQSLGTALP